jgi:uncharacterized protein DUF2252
MAVTDIRRANRTFETWLRNELHGDVVRRDLAAKWKKMDAGPFPFLRATYWRWAETIFDICPTLAKAPSVLAVGDIHLENFGTWRDDDGRVVWGVNDFDEAASMPYVLDLVRLATSAILARPSRTFRSSELCASILKGYAHGLKRPSPTILDEGGAWLRTLLVVPNAERTRFWQKVTDLAPARNPPPAPYRRALQAAMPEPGFEIAKFARRTAGAGSLGRPRWVGIADWRGGWVVREAKAAVPSAWTRISGRGPQALRCAEIASGRYRAPDPWWRLTGNIIVRRLSPNSRKIEVAGEPEQLLGSRMLRAMGHELASVHLGTTRQHAALDKDFMRRDSDWLLSAAKTAAKFVTREYKDWRKG